MKQLAKFCLLFWIALAPLFAHATCTTVAGPDAFTAADSTDVATYSANWLDQNALDSQMIIISNAYRSNGLDSEYVWQGSGSFNSDQCAIVEFAGSFGGADADRIGVVLRSNGLTNGSRSLYRCYYRPSGGAVFCEKEVSASGNSLGSVSVSFAAGNRLEVDALANGGNVDLVVSKDSGSGFSVIGTITDNGSVGGAVLTGGKPGIFGRVSAANLRGDNWIGGNASATPANTALPKVMQLLSDLPAANDDEFAPRLVANSR